LARLVAALFAAGLILAFSAAPASAASQVAGIQTHLLWSGVDASEVRRQLDLVRDSGAGLTRVDVGWASLQQTARDRYEPWFLDRLDAIVDAADARGVDLLLTFMNTPCWASTAPETLKQGCVGAWWDRGVTAYAPADPRDYSRAIGFLAARYRGRVAAWEIWNEPNHTGFWRAGDPASAYAELLKAAYPAVKAADPAAAVVGGSLSHSDHQFTQRLYDVGVKGSFDAFALHPYSDDVSPMDPRSTIDERYSFVRGVPKIREVMLSNGDDRPIWLTESGWSTSTSRTSDPWSNGVSEATQALFLRQQAEQVTRWPWVEVNVWFNLLDMGANREELYTNCGLWRVDGTPKPAWTAFRESAAMLVTPGAPANVPAPDPVVPAPAPPSPVPSAAADAPAGRPAAPPRSAQRKRSRAARRRAARRTRARRAHLRRTALRASGRRGQARIGHRSARA
jgi:polysaccharide biosynthesis protein PslG